MGKKQQELLPGHGSVVHILVVDDEILVREHIVRILQKGGWNLIEVAGNGVEALEKLEHGHFELCILDLQMSVMGGVEVIKQARKKGIETDFVVVTGFGSIEIAVEVMKLGAQDFLPKPIKPSKLISIVSKLLRKHQSLPHIRAERLDKYLAQHARQESLRVADLCEHFEISSRYVSLLFNKYLGISFPRRLTYHRVQIAKKLIETTPLRLRVVAKKCGFKDYRRLYEGFVKIEEVAPQEYRKVNGV
ncbi:MAG: response regulator [Gemmatimonadetes bacterium]|jgi:two-component system, response regulator YesN|nr:response regulator [Gemmatimonadota bacterium]